MERVSPFVFVTFITLSLRLMSMACTSCGWIPVTLYSAEEVRKGIPACDAHDLPAMSRENESLCVS